MDYLIWIPFLILLGIYCFQEKNNEFRNATTLKVVLSAYVACVAWLTTLHLGEFSHILMAIGLTCAVPADYFLQYIHKDIKMYRYGIICFGAMHVCLLIMFYTIWGIHLQEFLIWIIMIIVLSSFQNTEKWNLGKVKLELSVYTVLVTLMASKAISAYIIAPKPATLVLALGGLFFFISDLFLGIWNYYQEKFLYLALNRIIYFVGQLFLAYSLVLVL